VRDPLLQTLIAWGLVLLFAAAARHKLREPARFHAQLAEYRLLPERLVAPAGWLLAALELGLTIALLWSPLRQAAGAGAAALLALYAMAIGINLGRGRRHIDCGCGDAPVLLSPWLLARNAVLAMGAMTLTLTETQRALSWADLAVAIVGLPALVLTYRAVEQLLGNQSVLQEWRTADD
jgi:hypothetical protein